MIEPASLLQLSDFASLLLPRPREAHKGLFGHVLVVGGYYGMAGAVRLAAESALRVGAGLVSVATVPEHVGAVLCGRPEIMVHGIKKAKELKPLLDKATVIVVGPGLGQSAWSRSLLNVILQSPMPKVVDADALNLLAQQPHASQQWILTPHVGEAARLLQCSRDAIQANRAGSARQLQRQYGGVIVLKGAGSLVCTADLLSLCEAGNPGMASGGMGDVLSGVIGGLLAQQLSLQQGAELGVCLHACAGDLVAKQHGERGMLAMDLMPFLTKLVNP